MVMDAATHGCRCPAACRQRHRCNAAAPVSSLEYFVLRQREMEPHVRILVADDDDQLLSAVGDALTRSGASVTRAASGAELIDALTGEGPFDLVAPRASAPPSFS